MVKKAKLEDVKKIVEIDFNSRKKKIFSKSEFLKVMERYVKRQEVFFALKNKKEIGYIGFSKSGKDIYLDFLCVVRAQQRKGYATKLIKLLKKAKRVFLEVRSDNFPAIVFYNKFGFVVYGVRKKKGFDKLKMRLLR